MKTRYIIATILLVISFRLHAQNYSIEELKEYKDSLKVCSQNDKLKYYSKLSWGYRKLNPERATKYALDGLELAQDLGCQESIGGFNNILGVILTMVGDYNDALERHLNAIKIRTELKDSSGMGASLNNIGLVYEKLSQFDKALLYYKKSLAIKERQNDSDRIAISLNNIGTIHFKTGNYSEGVKYLSEAYYLAGKINNKRAMSLSLGNLSSLKQSQDSLDEARNLAFRTLKIMKELNDIHGEGYIYLKLARIEIDDTKYIKAIFYLEKSQKISRILNLKPLSRNVYSEFAKVYKLMDNYKLALMYHEKYTEINELLFNDTTSYKLFSLQSKYENEKNLVKIQNLELERFVIIRNFLLVIFGLFLLVSVLLYRKYIEKSKINSELAESEAFNKALISKLPEYLVVYLDYNIIFANKLFKDDFLINETDYFSKSVFDFFPPQIRPRVKEILEEGLSRNEFEDYEIEIDVPTKGKRLLRITGIVVPYKEKKAILGIISDITDSRNNEKELIKAKELAETSDKLKTEFLTQISHEIRTPLNVIISWSNLLKSEFGNSENEELSEGFKIISDEGQRIIRTVDLILNMSELQTNSYQLIEKEIDLNNDIISPIYSHLLREAKEKGLELVLECNTSETTITADEYSIHQIFLNIIENGIIYTNEGSVLTKIYSENNGLIVDITDTGIGIEEEYMTKIFEPFSQEQQGYTRRFEGNGLGLAISKKYCDLNNAKIEVFSKKGTGSTFRIIFNENNIPKEIDQDG